MATQTASPAAVTDAARLFEEYGPRLYRFCLGRMRSREEAEDALQSTFLRVHRALGKGVAPEYEAAWLYKIAHNVCLSRREVAGRRALVEAPRDLDEIEYALASPEEHHDELVGLSDALAAMPANLRQAFLLRQWQGLSYAEIADAMGTTVSAVETLLVRARRHLASALDADGKSPAKTLAGLLDLGALLGRLRSLLAGAAPAKLATGAVVVAVGGAGLGTAVVAVDAGSSRTPPQRSAGVLAKTPPDVGRSVGRVVRAAPSRPAASHAAAARARVASAPATSAAEPPALASSSSPQSLSTSASSLVPVTVPVPVPVPTDALTVPPLPAVDAPPVSSFVQSPLLPPAVQSAVDAVVAPAVEPPAVPALPVVAPGG